MAPLGEALGKSQAGRSRAAADAGVCSGDEAVDAILETGAEARVEEEAEARERISETSARNQLCERGGSAQNHSQVVSRLLRRKNETDVRWRMKLKLFLLGKPESREVLQEVRSLDCRVRSRLPGLIQILIVLFPEGCNSVVGSK